MITSWHDFWGMPKYWNLLERIFEIQTSAFTRIMSKLYFMRLNHSHIRFIGADSIPYFSFYIFAIVTLDQWGNIIYLDNVKILTKFHAIISYVKCVDFMLCAGLGIIYYLWRAPSVQMKCGIFKLSYYLTALDSSVTILKRKDYYQKYPNARSWCMFIVYQK